MILAIFLLLAIASKSGSIRVDTTTISDYVIVAANTTNVTEVPQVPQTSDVEKRDDSLQPESDKSDSFVNKFYVPEPSIEIGDNDENGKLLSLPKLKFPKLPKLPKFPSIFPPREIVVQLTTTVVQHHTVFNTIYPTCLKLSNNVQSVCDGTLITIIPTRPALPPGNIWRTELTGMSQPAKVENATTEDMSNEGKADSNFIQPSSTEFIQTTRFASMENEEPRKNILATSEMDHESDYSEQSSNAQRATLPLSNLNTDDTAKIAFFPHSSVEHEIQYVTKYLQVTRTQDVHDVAHTATILAEDCFPAELNLPFCEPVPLMYIPTLLTSKYPDTNSPEGHKVNNNIVETVNQSLAQVQPQIQVHPQIQVQPQVQVPPQSQFQPQFQVYPQIQVQPQQTQHPQRPEYHQELTMPTFDQIIQRAVQNIRAQAHRIAQQDLQRIATSSNAEIKVYGPMDANSHIASPLQYFQNLAVGQPISMVQQPLLVQDPNIISDSFYSMGRAMKLKFGKMHHLKAQNRTTGSESGNF